MINKLRKYDNKILDTVLLQNLTPTQELYLLDSHRFIYNPSGRRSRKTLLGVYKTINRALRMPGHYYSAAPTHQQAKKIFWKLIYDITYAMNIQKRVSLSERYITIPTLNGGESIIQVVGLDATSRVEGAAIRGMHITEFPDIPIDAWFSHLRPMFADEIQGDPIWLIADGTYDSRCPDWTDLIEANMGGAISYPETDKPVVIENPNDSDSIVYSWSSYDVIPEREMAKLKLIYEPKLFGQEFLGRPMESGQRVYYAYTSENDCDLTFEANCDTYLSFDFNINPFTCSVWQEQDHNGKKCKIAVKDFAFYDSNASKAVPKIIEWLRTNGMSKPRPQQLHLTGDHAGNSRNHAISYSAWNIIEMIFEESGIDAYKYTRRTKAGGLRDRQDSLNNRFAPFTGDPLYYVNRKLCPDLHIDLMKLKHKKNLQQDDEGGKRGHLADTASYMCVNFDRAILEYKGVS